MLVSCLVPPLDCHQFTRPFLRLCTIVQEMGAAYSWLVWIPSFHERPDLSLKVLQLYRCWLYKLRDQFGWLTTNVYRLIELRKPMFPTTIHWLPLFSNNQSLTDCSQQPIIDYSHHLSHHFFLLHFKLTTWLYFKEIQVSYSIHNHLLYVCFLTAHDQFSFLSGKNVCRHS